MVCGFLNKKGSSLLEVTVVLLVMGTLFAAVIPGTIDRINKAKYEKTVRELVAIAQASVNYFIFEGAWPSGIGSLAPQFIPVAVGTSPFGTSYHINCVRNMVTASVLIPRGVVLPIPQGPLLVVVNRGPQDQIDISQTVHNELTARLNYDLKYVY